MSKPTLCIDFDGVLHSYSSGWAGPDIIADPPVDGAMRFLWDASEHFQLAIFSSRSHQPGGLGAMQAYIRAHFLEHWAADRTRAEDILAEIQWPTAKPAAFLSIDDRALCFEGKWPAVPELLGFKPWNKRNPVAGATGSFSDGKLNPDDQGDLQMAVSNDPRGNVIVEFGKPVAWLGLPPANAIALAKVLLARAGAPLPEQ